MKSSPFMAYVLMLTLCWVAPISAGGVTPALLEELKRGGLVIYLRHAMTNHKQRDSVDLKLNYCNTQRNLSDQGRLQSQSIGVAFEHLGIKVGEVLSSPYCRCKETAKLAFGKLTVDHNLYFAVGLPRAEREAQSEYLRQALAKPPAEGTNTVLVSHTANLKEAAGIWPKPEAVMQLFRPVEGGYEHLGGIPPEYWAAIGVANAQ